LNTVTQLIHLVF